MRTKEQINNGYEPSSIILFDNRTPISTKTVNEHSNINATLFLFLLTYFFIQPYSFAKFLFSRILIISLRKRKRNLLRFLSHVISLFFCRIHKAQQLLFSNFIKIHGYPITFLCLFHFQDCSGSIFWMGDAAVVIRRLIIHCNSPLRFQVIDSKSRFFPALQNSALQLPTHIQRVRTHFFLTHLEFDLIYHTSRSVQSETV